VKDVHIAVGVLALALSVLTGALGVWCWWRARQNNWFWRVLRASQVVIVAQAALGGVLVLMGHKAPSLHLIYGLLPILVSSLGEQLRIASAQMVLDARGFRSSQEVGELPEEEQQQVVRAILQRELGVMTLAALVIVVLLVRAAGTA
jgi:heme A synthase